MNIHEFEKVKFMTYFEYCDYLQDKYGIGLADYMYKDFNKNPKCSRTKDGLIAHHKMEDRCVMLSNRYIAEMCPHEWQSKENIVYCDYLEHLLLHVLICRYPKSEMPVGIGGVYIIANELNDLYSGFETNQAWRKRCHVKVINDKDVYFRILDKFFDAVFESSEFNIDKLCHSFNQDFGLWNDGKNIEIYSEIRSLLEV